MTLAALEAVFTALNTARVHYLVVGGVAVNAHGYQRMTQDLDLALDLATANVQAALNGLAALGYRPLLPVPIAGFADPEQRNSWIRDKNLEAFSLVSPQFPRLTVDLLARIPFDFTAEWSRADRVQLSPGLEMPLLGIDALIAMKEAAGRRRDLDDAEQLRAIRRLREENR